MPGKPYTLSEMKCIVDYLKEHKLYSETRGRKMWIDFANSNQLDRTWQSLKETFLKRVLPDIHNPYYKLTVQQISSFKQGIDIEAKHNNKLEIRTISEGSSSNADNQNITEQPSTSKNIQEHISGEVIKSSKIESHTSSRRSSTETLVLEYETAEDIQRDLESPKSTNGSRTKSSRDLIIYTEPLTPMLQEVLHDFETDEDEPQMQIVENENERVAPGSNEKVNGNSTSFSPDEIRHSQSLITQKPVNTSLLKATDKVTQAETNIVDSSQSKKVKTLKLKKTQKGTWANKESDNVSSRSLHQKKDKLEKNNAENNDINSEIKEINLDENLKISEVNNTDNKDTDNTLVDNEEATGNKSTTVKTLNKDSPSKIQTAGTKVTQSVFSRKITRSQVAAESKNKMLDDKQHETSNPEVPKINDDFEEAVLTILNTHENSEENLQNASEDIPCGQQKIICRAQSSDIVETIKHKNNSEESLEVEHSAVVNISDKTTSEVNPCLQSVSLFAEQFSTVKYSGSESSDNETRTNKTVHENNKIDACISTEIKSNTQNETEEKKDTENTGMEVEVILDNELNTHEKAEGSSANCDTENKDKITKNTTAKINIQETRYENIDTKPNTVGKNIKNTFGNPNEAVLIKSHSESSSDSFKIPQKITSSRAVSKTQRDKVLANVFGFSSGGTNRKRSVSYRDRSSRRYQRRHRTSSRHSHISNRIDETESSDYMTASESDEFLAPRDRPRRLRRQYKRSEFDILSGTDGTLFVTYGKRVYPMMNEEKKIRHYLTSSNNDHEVSGRLKSNIMSDKLKRNSHVQENEEKRHSSISPILQTKLKQNNVKYNQHVLNHNEHSGKLRQSIESDNGIETIVLDKESETEPNQIVNVKIKFTKDIEVELNCPQTFIQPVLEKMVPIFLKETESKIEENPKVDKQDAASSMNVPTVTVTTDPETHEKVNKIESEIFKEIEERDKSESLSNVTKRRGRPRKNPSPSSSIASTRSPVKKSKMSNEEVPTATELIPTENIPTESKSTIESTDDDMKAPDVLKDVNDNKRQKRAPKKFGEAIASTSKALNIKRRSSTKSDTSHNPRRSSTRSETSNKLKVHIPENDSGVRYMFPESVPATRTNSRTRQTVKITEKSSENYAKNSRIPSTEKSLTTESTQGYQDSDISSASIGIRRKKKSYSTSQSYRGRQSRSKIRRKSHPYLADDDTCDTNTSIIPPSNPVNIQSSSLNTDVYRSESYQLLLPNTNNFEQLTKRDKTSTPGDSETNTKTSMNRNINSPSPNRETLSNINQSISPKTEGTSSNVTLPLSPALSVVENISIRKDMLIGEMGDHPTINETQSCDLTGEEGDCNKYFIAEVDVSIPLMRQDCEILKSQSRKTTKTNNFTNPKITSESLLNKIDTVNMEEQSSSDSLEVKLRNLLLESAKKMVQQMQAIQEDEHVMEVDNLDKEQKKTRDKKKRCSTPRKKTNTQKSKAPTESIIQEHTEFCAHNGRQSCPPSINIINCEDEIAVENDTASMVITETTNNRKGRNKKDIIKVKIQRPKEKKLLVEKKRTRSSSRLSVCTDSGINDTESGVFFQGYDDSIDLIHNHSETCINANECLADSIEFIEKSTSVISLDSVSLRMKSSEESAEIELFCSNAQDGADLNIRGLENEIDSASGPSSRSFNSLITEDLSDDISTLLQPRSSKWYLLSEEETTNSRFLDVGSELNLGKYANLKQIFPITCAVPNLSTISEMSKENDSRKPTMDTDNDNRYTENEEITNSQTNI